MPLMPCPECEGAVSNQARTCPHCGHPLVDPWMSRLENAWRLGFRHAWIAAVGVPIVVLLPAVWVSEFLREPQVVATSILPWVPFLAIWGFVVAIVAIAIAALLRMRWVRGRSVSKSDIWQWSVPSALLVVVACAIWVAVSG